MHSNTISVGYGSVNTVKIGSTEPLVFIGGPCAIESKEHAFKVADMINKICNKHSIPWIYKSCVDKACRSSPDS